jgi:hypothetical protein
VNIIKENTGVKNAKVLVYANIISQGIFVKNVRVLAYVNTIYKNNIV